MSFAIPRKRALTRIIIAASPSEVWDVLGDLRSYERWNPVLSLRPWRGQALGVGRRAWLRLNLFRVPLVVPVLIEVAEAGRELRWVGGPRGLFRGRHYFELRERGDETELIHGEHFEGLLLPLMWPLMEDELDRLYRSINEALAAQVARL